MVIYTGKIKPLDGGKQRNRLEYFDEIMISYISFFMILYTDYIDNVEWIYNFGWMMIMFYVIFLFVHVASMFRGFIRSVKMYYVKYSRRFSRSNAYLYCKSLS